VKPFRGNQRVLVLDPEHGAHHMTGTVVRLRRSDNAAWVNIDDDCWRKELAAFTDESDPRHRHVLLYPEQCVSIVGATIPAHLKTP